MPVMRIQPVVARAVGELLAAVAEGPPGQPTLEVAGPEPANLVRLARAFVRRRGERVAVIPFGLPGAAGKAMRSGGQLPPPGARLVGPRFADWLVGEDARAGDL